MSDFLHSGISRMAKPRFMNCIVTTWQIVTLYVSTVPPRRVILVDVYNLDLPELKVFKQDCVDLSMVLTGSIPGPSNP